MEVGKQVVCEEDRLCALQVGVAGHDHAGVAMRHRDQRLLERPQPGDGLLNGLLAIEAHVRGHLIVAGACGVQPAGGLADLLVEARLHVHVDVLQLFPPGEGAILHLLQDALETRVDELRVLLRDDALATQHPRVGH